MAYHQLAMLAYMSPAHIRDLSDLDKIQVPPREYGYREVPMTWTDLVQIVDVEKNLAKLSRSVHQQQVYIYYQRELLKEWKSVYDHVLVSKFDLEKRQAEIMRDGKTLLVWESHPPLSNISEVRKVLKPNEFPYYTADGIEHWCLWKLRDDVTEEDIAQAKDDLQELHGDIVDYVWWKNPPHLKSLPDIDHVHIMCRRSTAKIQGENIV